MAHPPRLPQRLRAAVPAAALAAALLTPAPSTAHAGHHASAASGHHASAASGYRAGHAGHAAHAAEAARTRPMFVVADPRNPRIARGARGPLWKDYAPRTPGTTAMGLTYAQRYLASQRARATDAAAQRTAKGLTTAQATKKLSKKCQRLVKITKASQLKKLRKADRKARTKCLEQRRKIIADSKKDPKPGTTTPPGAPAPNTPAPNTPAPTTPTPTTTPAPTTPGPTTPALPAECATAGSSPVTVTAIDEGRQFELNSCGVAAGSIQFRFDNTDADEEHNLVLADGVTSGGGPSGTVRVISTNIKGGQSATKSFTLPAGDYVLICTVDGHSAMTVKFKVF